MTLGGGTDIFATLYLTLVIIKSVFIPFYLCVVEFQQRNLQFMSPEADVPVGAVGAEDVGTEGGMQDAVHRACVRRKHVFKVVVPVHCTLY